MGLSREEEHAFAAIVSELDGRAVWKVRWRLVGVSVALVAVAVALAALLGLPAQVTLAFSATFTLSLAVGLLVIATRDRRRSLPALKSPSRRHR